MTDYELHPSAERLYKAAEALKGVRGQSAVARLLIASPQTLKNWESRGVSRQGAITAQERIGCSAVWLLDGTGEMAAGEDAGQLTKSTEFLPGFKDLSIPLLANSASMGDGDSQLHEEVVVGRITVSPDWAVRTLKPTGLDALRFIHGYGDSMNPTFADGDVLLVDTGVHECKVDGVYVLEANDRLYIKRVRQRLDGSYEISSDNPTVKTVDVLDGRSQVGIRGRVLWAWNGRKL